MKIQSEWKTLLLDVDITPHIVCPCKVQRHNCVNTLTFFIDSATLLTINSLFIDARTFGIQKISWVFPERERGRERAVSVCLPYRYCFKTVLKSETWGIGVLVLLPSLYRENNENMCLLKFSDVMAGSGMGRQSFPCAVAASQSRARWIIQSDF